MTNFYQNLASFGDAPAIILPSGAVTYRSLDEMAKQAAANLGTERCLVFLEASNTPEAISTYLGCLIGGHPVYLFGSQSEAQLGTLREIYRPNRVYGFREGAFTQLAHNDERIELHPSLRVLLATSGSTGSPKLVKLSDRNIQSNAASIVEYLKLDSTERALTSLKFNYSYGMSIVNSHMACGGALVLTDRSVLDDEFWVTFKDSKGTSFAGVPYTFETLYRSGRRVFETPSLRYATQAGGRLAPELVRHFAELSRTSGWRFYVMYGQTEAAPRMTYLPPDLAADHPHCIGIPVPSGRIFILDSMGREIHEPDTPGELAYAGPNVMLGYATAAADLHSDQTPERLLTGDIACRNSTGLYYITGRSSRFVKPFGIRVNLDDIQAEVRKWAPDAACTGTDENILIALVRGQSPPDLDTRIEGLSALYKLPLFAFDTIELAEIPRLANGKTAYKAILEHFEQIRKEKSPSNGKYPGPTEGDVFSIILSHEFVAQMKAEFFSLLGVGGHRWKGVADILSTTLSVESVAPGDSFVGLSGDSLSYVQASVAIEEYLGRVPPKWEYMTVAELEQLNQESSYI